MPRTLLIYTSWLHKIWIHFALLFSEFQNLLYSYCHFRYNFVNSGTRYHALKNVDKRYGSETVGFLVSTPMLES